MSKPAEEPTKEMSPPRFSWVIWATAIAALGVAAAGSWYLATLTRTETQPSDSAVAVQQAEQSTSTTTTTTAPIDPEDPESVNLAYPAAVDPPALPTALRGLQPRGAVETIEFRVFENGGVSGPEGVGDALNSCDHEFWTARWRSRSPDIEVKATHVVAAGPSANPAYPYPEFVEAVQGGTGFMAGTGCEMPVFSWGTVVPEENGAPREDPEASYLTDVLFEIQRWVPAV